MRPGRVSRAAGVIALFCAICLSPTGALAQGGKWEPPVPPNLFNDGKTEEKNPQPTHRLQSTKCDDCQDIVNQLQAALDDWYVMQLADGKGIQIDHSDSSSENREKEQAKNKQVGDAMAGLGQPNGKDLGAKQQQQKKDAKDKKGTHGNKDALAKEIKRLSDLLENCLKKCADVTPTPTPTPTPEIIDKPASKPGEEELPKLPTGDCWPSEAAKEQFYKELKDADDELEEDAKEATSHGMIKNAIDKIKKKQEEAAALRAAADKIKKVCEKPKGGGGSTTGPGKGKPKKAPRVTTGGNVSYGGPTDDFCTQISEHKISVDAVGTGETIGHVADLFVANLTDQPIEVAIPPTILESKSKKNQDYGIPKGETVDVPPHRSVKVPLDGVCLARNKPPVGDGERGDIAINDCDPEAHIDRHQADTMRRIAESKYDAADNLEHDGKLKSIPYHDPKERKDIVVQWSTWADPRISEITGAPPATKDDLKKTVYKQAEEQGPLTDDKKKKLDDGIDTIWDKIELTTKKAKDLEKPPPEEEETPPTIPPGTSENVSNDTPTPAPQTQEKPKKEKKKKKNWPKPIQDWIDAKNAADEANINLTWAKTDYHYALIQYGRKNSAHYRELSDACVKAREKAAAKNATQQDKADADKVCSEVDKQEAELAKDFTKTEEGKAASDKLNEAQKAADKANAAEKEAGKDIDQTTKDAVQAEENKNKGIPATW